MVPSTKSCGASSKDAPNDDDFTPSQDHTATPGSLLFSPTASTHPPKPVTVHTTRHHRLAQTFEERTRLLNLTITISKIPSHNSRILTAADDSPCVELQLEYPCVTAVRLGSMMMVVVWWWWNRCRHGDRCGLCSGGGMSGRWGCDRWCGMSGWDGCGDWRERRGGCD